MAENKNIDIAKDDEEDEIDELQHCLLAEYDSICREICRQKGISFEGLYGETVDCLGFECVLEPEVEYFTYQLEQKIRDEITKHIKKELESIDPALFRYADYISPLEVWVDFKTGKPTDFYNLVYGSMAS